MEEYIPLDFDDASLQPVGTYAYCDQCGAEHWLTWADEYTCDVCGTNQSIGAIQ